MNQQLKISSAIIHVLAFTCAVLLITNRTYGYPTAIRIGFYIFGATALILGFINSKNDPKQDFNPLFWIGTLVIFIGIVLKTSDLPFAYYIIIGGGLLTGASYLFNPFNPKKEDDSELLDS